MADAILTDAKYHDEAAARAHLEAIRWPNGPICPHCGGVERNSKLNGKGHRPGLYFCGDCREQFTVTVGTVFESSKVPLHKWLLATQLLCSSKKGMSTHQLHRTIGVTYKTAWFMTHRIREAMTTAPEGQMGGDGGPVQADETYWGNNSKKSPGARGGGHKMKIVALVEPNGSARGFHVPNVNGKTVGKILRKHVAKESHLMTDESSIYKTPGKKFAAHSSVNHSAKEYARGDVTTNHVEGYFSILKRGLVGTYHHVSEHHLQRYVNEFDFRYNNRIALGIDDVARANTALQGIGGKRLTYRRING